MVGIGEPFWDCEVNFFRLRVFYAGAKHCAIEACRKIHFLHHWRASRHRYDGVLRRLADHRSNVRTNSSDYPCLVENEPACSFQLACSSGSAPFSASRCPAHELMDVYQTNCILFAQTASWSPGYLAIDNVESHRNRGSIKLCGICKFASTACTRAPWSLSLWQKTRNETVGRLIIASRLCAVFINNNASDIYAGKRH